MEFDTFSMASTYCSTNLLTFTAKGFVSKCDSGSDASGMMELYPNPDREDD